MEVEIIKQGHTDDIDFSIVQLLENEIDEVIVLASGRYSERYFEGIILYPISNSLQPNYYSHWNKDRFKKFSGEIKLKQP